VLEAMPKHSTNRSFRDDKSRFCREASSRPRSAVVRVAPTRPRPELPAGSRTPGPKARRVWVALQTTVLLVGVVLVAFLLLWPAAGIALMWNVLIPVAPGLVTIAPGLWRNICPMATFHMLPQKLGLARNIRMPTWGAAALSLASMTLL